MQAYGCVGVDVSCGGLVDECVLSCMWRSAAVSSNQVMSESSGSAASFVSCKGQLSCVFILKLIWMMLPGACQPLAHQWRWCEDINTVQRMIKASDISGQKNGQTVIFHVWELFLLDIQSYMKEN